MPSNSIVHAHGTNCIFVFFYSFGKCPSCLPYVTFFTFITWYIFLILLPSYLLSSASSLLSLNISLLYYYFLIVLLASERSEQDTLRSVQLRIVDIYILYIVRAIRANFVLITRKEGGA